MTSGVIEKIVDLLKLNSYFIVVLPLVLLCVFLFAKTIILKNKARKTESRLSIVDAIDDIVKEDEYEEKLQRTLELVSQHIPGDGYFLYVYEEKNKRYKLERSIFKDKNNDGTKGKKLEIGYGRLMAYEKEAYSPKLMFENLQMSDEISASMDGRFSVLMLPVLREKGFITVSVKKGEKYVENLELKYLNDMLKKVFESITDQGALDKSINDKAVEEKKPIKERKAVEEKKPIEESKALTEKMPLGGKTPLEEGNPKRVAEIIDMALLIVGADAGLFMSIDNNYCELKSISGFSPETEGLVNNNIESCMELVKTINSDEPVRISQDDLRMEHIPDYLKIVGFKQYFLIRSDEGIFIACYNKVPEDGFFINYRMRMVNLLMAKLDDNYTIKKNRKSDGYYNNELDTIVRAIDDEEPYFVGSSDLKSRYVAIIARGMGMNLAQSKEIQRAAFLSNIGVLVVPESILRKKGIYNKNEYESMKRHAEAGAGIVKIITGNTNISNYILYHHEAINGEGYPFQLKEEEIPVESRILGVAQSFASKTKGRQYRQPMPYARIIPSMKEDEALDQEAVNALIVWFRKKQDDERIKGKALGNCWEIHCSPEKICEKCPAYLSDDRFCWEFEENNCQAHGNNSCETCFVYSEYLERKQREQEN